MNIKKCILSLILLVISDFAFSQEQHLKFEGISLGGTLSSFRDSLISKGYKTKYDKNDAVWLVGKYNDQDAIIAALGTPKSKKIWKVAVMFKPISTWDSLKVEFNEYKSNCDLKYGQPIESHEEFSSPFEEGDGKELVAISNNKCNYCSRYKIGNGTLALEFSPLRGIQLSFEDLINSSIKQAEEVDANSTHALSSEAFLAEPGFAGSYWHITFYLEKIDNSYYIVFTKPDPNYYYTKGIEATPFCFFKTDKGETVKLERTQFGTQLSSGYFSGNNWMPNRHLTWYEFKIPNIDDFLSKTWVKYRISLGGGYIESDMTKGKYYKKFNERLKQAYQEIKAKEASSNNNISNPLEGF